jgi:hypothetical protein
VLFRKNFESSIQATFQTKKANNAYKKANNSIPILNVLDLMHLCVYVFMRLYWLNCIEMGLILLLRNDVDITALSLVMIYSSKVVLPSLRLLMIISNQLSVSDLT